MAVTLRQIAEQTGVSAQTVSRILRGEGERHHPDTCRRVREEAEKLGYRPNFLSRALLGGKSQSIGVVIKGLSGWLSIARIRGLSKAADAAGYMTCLVNVDQPGDDSEQVGRAVEQLLDRRVDGLIILRSMPVSPAIRRMVAELPKPVVWMDWGPSGSPHRVRMGRSEAIAELIEHLAQLGHRRAVFFPSQYARDFLEHKVLPYQRACAKAGIELHVEEMTTVRPDATHEALGYDVVRAFLAKGHFDATAFLMNNDEGAVGALAALREAGFAVPDDVSVSGYDDLGAASYSVPPLTTIRGPRQDLGRIAFEMLHQLMLDPQANVQPAVLASKLIVRQSTGPAPSPRPADESPRLGTAARVATLQQE